MTEVNITKARNFPLNRDGETLDEAGTEGDLVGLTTVDNETRVVQADADASNPQPAMGVLMEEVQDVSALQVSGFERDYIEQRQLRRDMETGDYTLVGDEGTYIFSGIMLSNVDEDWGLTPNEPVYLAVGGGYTQTKPDGTTGNLIQRVGVAVAPEEILLDVDFEYTMA